MKATYFTAGESPPDSEAPVALEVSELSFSDVKRDLFCHSHSAERKKARMRSGFF
jgi:hypothetical protein